MRTMTYNIRKYFSSINNSQRKDPLFQKISWRCSLNCIENEEHFLVNMQCIQYDKPRDKLVPSCKMNIRHDVKTEILFSFDLCFDREYVFWLFGVIYYDQWEYVTRNVIQTASQTVHVSFTDTWIFLHGFVAKIVV